MGAAAPSPVRHRQAPEPEDLRPPSQEAGATAVRPPRVQRFLSILCALLAIAAPLCLFLGNRGFAPVIGIAGLLCIPWARPTPKDWTGVLILAALVLWAAVSVAWSPAPNLHLPHSAKALSRFTILHLAIQLVFCTALVTTLSRMDGARARKALGWMTVGFLLVPPLLVEEGLTQARLYQALPALIHRPIRADWLPADLAQGGYVMAVLVWPLAVFLGRRGWLGRALALTLLAFIPLSMVALRGIAPTVALAVGLGCFAIAWRGGPRAVRAMGTAAAAYVLAMPLIMLAIDRLGLHARFQSVLPPSWSARLRIWGFVAEQFARTPVRGAGLDASRTFGAAIPLHPHDGPLQLWFELGAVGGVLGALFWFWLWRRVADCAARDRLLGATAAATAAAYLTIGSVSFGLWQEWWLCVGAFAMALCVLLGKTLPSAKGS